MRLRLPVLASLVVLGLLLAFPACGGGGDAGTEAGPYTPSGATMSASEEALARAILTEINNHRAGLGAPLPAYTWHAASAQVGYDHSLDMDVRGFWSHSNPDGLDGTDRITAAGITHAPGIGLGTFAGENLYTTWCTPTPCDSVPPPAHVLDDGAGKGWNNSPGHYTQLVAPNPVPTASTMPAWTHCGIGVHVKPDGSQTWITAVFLRNPN